MGGPYVKAAFLCDQVIEGKDNVLSFIRVIDKTTRSVVGPGAPTEMTPFQHRLKLVVILVAGDAVGRHDVRIDIREPSGLSKPGPTVSVGFTGSASAHNLIADVELSVEQEGPYWFEVYLDEGKEPITKMPWQVSYQRMQLPPSPASPP